MCPMWEWIAQWRVLFHDSAMCIFSTPTSTDYRPTEFAECTFTCRKMTHEWMNSWPQWFFNVFTWSKCSKYRRWRKLFAASLFNMHEFSLSLSLCRYTASEWICCCLIKDQHSSSTALSLVGNSSRIDSLCSHLFTFFQVIVVTICLFLFAHWVNLWLTFFGTGSILYICDGKTMLVHLFLLDPVIQMYVCSIMSIVSTLRHG